MRHRPLRVRFDSPCPYPVVMPARADKDSGLVLPRGASPGPCDPPSLAWVIRSRLLTCGHDSMGLTSACQGP